MCLIARNASSTVSRMYNVAVSMIVVDEETGKILLIQQYGKPSYILVLDM